MKNNKDLQRITLDLPSELQKRLKAYCAMNRLTMREFIVELIEKKLSKEESK